MKYLVLFSFSYNFSLMKINLLFCVQIYPLPPQESSYYPQVEAISPTPMDTREDNSPDSTSQIVKQIELVDRDIMKLETSLSKMAKKAEELEAEAKLPVKEGGEDAEAKAAKEAEEAAEEAKNKNQSLPQLIYAANKVGVFGSKLLLIKLLIKLLIEAAEEAKNNKNQSLPLLIYAANKVFDSK